MSHQSSHVVAADAVVAGDDVLVPGWLEVTGERVVAVGAGTPPRPADTLVPEGTVVPGFVDMHVHGGGGCSFASGDLEEATRVVAFHRGRGTTTMLASLVTARRSELLRSVAGLAELVDDGLLGGVHLEGPWLSPGKRGAHDPAALRDPDPRELDALLHAGRGAIRMVTVAPERPGALDLVRRLADAGVTVAVGHTEADYETTLRAVEAGARVATHLFNAMPPLHHRSPGPVLALLDDPRVVLELVADGTHLHPSVLRHVITTAGPRRVALVTDAMAAAGMPDGSYRLGSQAVEVSGGTARLADGTIAGSTATTEALFAAALEALAGAPEPRPRAAQMTAGTPASAVGLDDVGALTPGRRADLVVVDRAGAVTRVMVRGRWVE